MSISAFKCKSISGSIWRNTTGPESAGW